MALASAMNMYGLDASKPTSNFIAGRIYIATDTHKLYVDNGIAWVDSGLGAGGGTLTYHTVVMAADTALTNGVWNTLVSIAVAAGTWLCFGQARIYNPGSTANVGLRITDGTNVAGSIPFTIGGSTAAGPFVHGVLVESGSGTITLQAQPDGGTMTAYKAGYPGSDPVATQLTMVKIA